MNSNDLDDERAAFERHWYNFYHSGSIKARSDGRYMQPIVQHAWEAWQARAASPQAPEFKWPPLPALPHQGFYAFDRALFTEHQMQGYANAYGEAVRAAMAASPQLAQTERALTADHVVACMKEALIEPKWNVTAGEIADVLKRTRALLTAAQPASQGEKS